MSEFGGIACCLREQVRLRMIEELPLVIPLVLETSGAAAEEDLIRRIRRSFGMHRMQTDSFSHQHIGVTV